MRYKIPALCLLLLMTAGCGGKADAPETAVNDDTAVESAYPENHITDRKIYYCPNYAKKDTEIFVSEDDEEKILLYISDELEEMRSEIKNRTDAEKAENAEEGLALECEIRFYFGSELTEIAEDGTIILTNIDTGEWAERELDEGDVDEIFEIMEGYMPDSDKTDEEMTAAANETYKADYSADISDMDNLDTDIPFQLSGIDDNTVYYSENDYEDEKKAVVLSDEEVKEITDLINSVPKKEDLFESIDNIMFTSGNIKVSLETRSGEAAVNMRRKQNVCCASLDKAAADRINEIVYEKTGHGPKIYSE